MNPSSLNTQARQRRALISGFLSAHGWADADLTLLAGDASARSYSRLSQNGKIALLMDAAPALEGAHCTAEMSEQRRKSLGYTASARLAGTNPHAFITLAGALRRRGFSAPKILAADLQNGLILLEDLGDALFARILETKPEQEARLYSAAISALAALQRSNFGDHLREIRPQFKADWPLLTYDTLALQAEADLFADWYVPHFKAPLSAQARRDWHGLWETAYQHLSAHPPGLALRDFHAENIFWLPERDGQGNIGLIDFQDGLYAHPSYDLVSLLEDARRDVSPDLTEPLIAQFCAESLIEDTQAFRAAYAVQAAQRNAKILGIFVRLCVRDKKPHYLDLLPRVRAHFAKDLAHPALSGLREWTQMHAPSVFAP